jgi:hypothetical protein
LDKIQKAANRIIESGKDPAKLFELTDATLDGDVLCKDSGHIPVAR